MKLQRTIPHAVIAAVVIACAALSAVAASAVSLPNGEHDYNSPRFVVTHAWTKFAYLLGEPFRDDMSRAGEDALLQRFFELNALINEADQVAGDPATPPDRAASAAADAQALRDERAAIENTAERILEGRLTALAEDLGLTRRLGVDLVWPPVDIEFEGTPSVLVRSPRDEIRKDSERLLRGDLPIERVKEIEETAESDGETSALVVRIGGIAMYPAIIPPSESYRFVLADMAHEWLHHYLFFTPLGRRYYESDDLRTLNETVANIGGDALGDLLYERYPLPERQVTSRPAPGSPQPAIDFTAEMRALRTEVEALLAQGKVEDAERLMEEKRRYLAQHGYRLRRINQAYFAFHGSYADTPASIDPIGPKLEDLLASSGSVRDFIRTAQEFRSRADLDAALDDAPRQNP